MLQRALSGGGGKPCDTGTITFQNTNPISIPLSFTPTKACIWSENAAANQYISMKDENNSIAIIGSTEAWSVSSIAFSGNSLVISIPSTSYIGVPLNWMAIG